MSDGTLKLLIIAFDRVSNQFVSLSLVNKGLFKSLSTEQLSLEDCR
jgi:hypothetical protein